MIIIKVIIDYKLANRVIIKYYKFLAQLNSYLVILVNLLLNTVSTVYNGSACVRAL